MSKPGGDLKSKLLGPSPKLRVHDTARLREPKPPIQPGERANLPDPADPATRKGRAS